MAGPSVDKYTRIVIPASLFFTNAAVLLFGLTVTAIGVWAFLQERSYFSISDGDPELTRLPLSLILVGMFVCLLSLLGMFGALLIRTIGGRIFVGTYAFVLALVILSQFGSGATAIRFRGRLEEVFVNSSSIELLHYGEAAVQQRWDRFQTEHKCCGSEGYFSYEAVFHNNTVPASCCAANLTGEESCEEVRENVTAEDVMEKKIYGRGCPEAVLGVLMVHLNVLAAAALVFGVAQTSGIVVATVALFLVTRKGKSGGRGYTRLKRTMISS